MCTSADLSLQMALVWRVCMLSADVSLQMALPAALEHGTIYCLISAGAYPYLRLAGLLETEKLSKRQP